MWMAIYSFLGTTGVYQLSFHGQRNIGFIENISRSLRKPVLKLDHLSRLLRLRVDHALKATKGERHDGFWQCQNDSARTQYLVVQLLENV